MNIGYLGIPGSYSETALTEYLPAGASKTNVESFDSLVAMLKSGELSHIILPVENSTTGMITRTMDLLKYENVYIVDEWYLPIENHLWAKSKMDLSELTHVYSHPEAFTQTEDYFKDYPNIKRVSYTDTANAARHVAESDQTSYAALAGDRAGRINSLVKIASNINSEQANTTRFFILSTKKNEELGALSYFYIETPHKPGALLKLLNIFDEHKCNLLSLNSRPIQNKPFRYGFFIEVDILDTNLGALINTLKTESTYHHTFGSFNPFRGKESP